MLLFHSMTIQRLRISFNAYGKKGLHFSNTMKFPIEMSCSRKQKNANSKQVNSNSRIISTKIGKLYCIKTYLL